MELFAVTIANRRKKFILNRSPHRRFARVIGRQCTDLLLIHFRLITIDYSTNYFSTCHLGFIFHDGLAEADCPHLKLVG
jgi:hypothetical protein